MTKIDRTSPLPLYAQLKQVLLEKLENEWKPGDMVPGDQELEKIYGVSRITVRQALSDLVNDGLLERVRGRGTFVTQPKFSHDPVQRLALTEQMAEQGITPGWQLLGTEWITSPPYVRQALQIDDQARVFHIRRLRLANDEPFGYHDAYVPEAIGQQINQASLLNQSGASLNYLLDLPQLPNSKASRKLEAVLADELLAQQLSVAEASAIFRIERTIVDAGGHPIEFLRASYRGDRFAYHLTL